MDEFKSLLGVEGKSDKLKKIVQGLKHQNTILTDENRELGTILQAFRDGNYNQVEGAKLFADE